MPVVAAVDRSERASSVIDTAKTLADDAGFDLHVVHVGEPELPHQRGGYDPERAEHLSAQKASGVARELGEEVLNADEFHPVGLEGDPAKAVLEYAAEEDASYVVVSARKQSPIGQAVFGSVTQSVLLNADRPVVAAPHARG